MSVGMNPGLNICTCTKYFYDENFKGNLDHNFLITDISGLVQTGTDFLQ